MQTTKSHRHLTQHQKYVLQWLDDNTKFGGIVFEDQYRTSDDFRCDAKLAHRFYLKIMAE